MIRFTKQISCLLYDSQNYLYLKTRNASIRATNARYNSKHTSTFII